MFALVLYWTWTSGTAITRFPAKACIDDVASTITLTEAAATVTIDDSGLVCE